MGHNNTSVLIIDDDPAIHRNIDSALDVVTKNLILGISTR